MLEGLNFIILNVTDIEEARAFYTEKLGFEAEGAGPAFVQLKQAQPGATLALQLSDKAAPSPQVELWWQVTDADTVYAQLVGRGVESVSAPKDEPFGRAFSIKDNSGNQLNMYQLPAQSRN